MIEAIEISSLPAPQVVEVLPVVDNNNFTFTGTAIPNQDVIVYINSEKTLVYRTTSDANGLWSIDHSQDSVELVPGQHSIFAVSVDKGSKVKTPASALRLFIVEKSFWVKVYNYLNLWTTLIAVSVLVVAIFFLYRVKQRETVKA